MFLDLRASFLPIPASLTASIVIEVIGNLIDLIVIEDPVLERIGGVAGLVEVSLLEGVSVDDQEAAGHRRP